VGGEEFGTDGAYLRYRRVAEPGVSGARMDLGDDIKDEVNRALRYDDPNGFCQIISHLRRLRHENIATTLKHAYAELEKAIEREGRRSTHDSSPFRIDHVWKQAGLLREAMIETVSELKKTSEGAIHIDLSQWRKSCNRSLMQDLLDDDLREGVVIRPRRHGKNQPTELRRSLRNEHGLPSVADAIESVEGEARTYKLALSPTQITFDPPKT